MLCWQEAASAHGGIFSQQQQNTHEAENLLIMNPENAALWVKSVTSLHEHTRWTNRAEEFN